jgi:hypothetical protein
MCRLALERNQKRRREEESLEWRRSTENKDKIFENAEELRRLLVADFFRYVSN